MKEFKRKFDRGKTDEQMSASVRALFVEGMAVRKCSPEAARIVCEIADRNSLELYEIFSEMEDIATKEPKLREMFSFAVRAFALVPKTGSYTEAFLQSTSSYYQGLLQPSLTKLQQIIETEQGDKFGDDWLEAKNFIESVCNLTVRVKVDIRFE